MIIAYLILNKGLGLWSSIMISSISRTRDNSEKWKPNMKVDLKKWNFKEERRYKPPSKYIVQILIGSPRPPKLVPILFGENDKGEKA